MFLSEFLELFSALHKADCIPKAAVKFFFHLTHASPYYDHPPHKAGVQKILVLKRMYVGNLIHSILG